MRRLTIATLLLALVFLTFQNCGTPNENILNASGVSVSCTPKTSPCLKYRLTISNLQSSKGVMSVMLQGTIDEGVTANATSFSTNCQQVNGATAYCPFDEKMTATIVSNSTTSTVKGDGRNLRIEMVTASNLRNSKSGTLNKVSTEGTAAPTSPDAESCLEVIDEDGSNGHDFQIPFSALQPCKDVE